MATTFPVEQAPQTAFKLHHSSPLDTLVRRTSARRTRTVVQSTASSQQYPSSLIDEYVAPKISSLQEEQDVDVDPYGGYATSEIPQDPPSRPFARQPPASPLLHSHFARNSTATASMAGSYSDLRSSMGSRNAYQESEYRYRDDESVYSQVDSLVPALRDSWQPGVRPEDQIPHGASTKSTKAPDIYPRASRAAPVPTVVISSSDVDNSNDGPRVGRVPVVKQITSNFSRPVRPASQSQPEQYGTTLQQAVIPPPLPPTAHDQKRRVLERNAHRTAPNSPSQQPHPQGQMKFFHRSKSPTPSAPATTANPYLGVSATQVRQAKHPSPLGDPSPNTYTEQPTTTAVQISNSPHQSSQHRSPSPNTNGSRLPQQPLSDQQPSDRRSPQPTFSQPSPSNEKSTGLSPIALPRHPPARSNSPVSLYSTYSYYNFENAEPSPVSPKSPSRTSPTSQQPPNGSTRLQPSTFPNPSQQPQGSRSPNNNNNPRMLSPFAGNSRDNNQYPTPQDFLLLGIQNHEANRLGESAIYFERSAKENGGCGVGMLMWGLTLRHGWGCEKNEKVGFKWLSKAAENAVSDLETARSSNGKDTLLIQDELVLAIYEVGQCFFHGWGVIKDQKMAVSYYTVAARLGDQDAQNDLAFCLANGKGCKKDRKEAAKWYRAAVAQGASDVGLAWIYKEKFM